jgi:L-aminopeptidase/D-esterase-like protein
VTLQPGPTNTLTDVRGLRVGHATRTQPGWMTGTTVVLVKSIVNPLISLSNIPDTW